jgi:methyl-accepting chemotaxis protein
MALGRIRGNLKEGVLPGYASSCPFGMHPTEDSAMNFLDQAINAHSQWKVKLLTAVNGGEVPDKAKCCVDNQCDLGKWIYGEGLKAHGTKPEFAVLRETHKKFHSSVGEVVELVSQKKVADAKKNILEGQFNLRSKEVVKALMDLKSHVH